MSLLRGLLAVVALCGCQAPPPVRPNAAPATAGPYTFTVTNGTATITSFEDYYSDALSITNRLGGCPVTTIGTGAFENCRSLDSITIPNGVTSIGTGAFADCAGLASVTIPSSVTSIGYWSFRNCTNLTTVTVDPANPAFSSLDGVLFNKGQTTLIQYPGAKVGSYTIPGSVTSIADWAFHDCTALTSVTIPASVTTIGDFTFYRCSGLTSIAIPASVTNISECAFALCTNLDRAFFEGNAPASGRDAFRSTPATVYYHPENTGWRSTFCGRPTAVWEPDATGPP